MASLQYRIFSPVISLIPIRLRLQILYFRRFRKLIDYDNPVAFNELLQVRKLNDRNKILTKAADKIKSKQLVQSLINEVYIPRTLWCGDCAKSIDDLDISLLPRDYVFKANHTSQTLRIIRDGNHLSKNEMRTLADDWLKHDQSASLGEWAYKNIPKRIFIEEFLDFEGQAPDDYKFFVYSGRVHFIQLDSDRFTNHCRNMFDRDWNDLGFEYSHKRKTTPLVKPHFLDDMLTIAEELGKLFDFIRVDLYYYKGQVAFGELTVYPGAGFEKFPDEYWDIQFGKPWLKQ